MDDRTQHSTDKQKKIASAKKKLKQFQKRKTPEIRTMEENNFNSDAGTNYASTMEGGTPHIDDMSTWPNYNQQMENSPSKVDYSLNGSHADHGTNGNRLSFAGEHHQGSGGHRLEGYGVDLESVDAASPNYNAEPVHGRVSSTNLLYNDNAGGQQLHPQSPKVENSYQFDAMPATPVVNVQNLVNSAHTSPSVNSTFQNADKSTTASTEGLQQLSRKINGLISESKDYLNGDVLLENEDGLHELELRNRELASSVEKLYQENEKLRMGNNELKQHNNQLATQLQQERELFDERIRREMGAVKEQLQVHIQTIGILVAEKSELQSSVVQAQKDADKRQREVEELSGRLKASRTRVNELEREISSSTTSSLHFEKSKNDLSKEVERLRLEAYNATRALDETKRQNSELQEKLQVKMIECDSFDQSIGNLKHMVEMKDVLIQQLSSQPNDVHAQALDLLQQERVELLNRLEQYNEAFHQLTAERDHITDQYQTYIDQLTVQVAQGQAQVHQLHDEKERLSLSLNEAQEANESLSEQLNQSAAQVTTTTENESNSARIADLQSRLESLTSDYRTISQAFDEQTSNNSQLTRMIDERDSRIAELESQVDMLQEDTVDKGQLLESIQSDRVSLSRAMSQNKELRSQLEELQTAFVKVQNENMELATGFSTVEHNSKQYSSRFHFLEQELEEKIQEIDSLNEKLDTVNSEMENLSLATSSSSSSHLAMASADGSVNETGESGDSVDHASEHMHRDEDIIALEKKYMQITKEKADLLDTKERLEHTVTQLEGETDTIGEYITIYHHERALLNDRQLQQENHLSQLAREREELKSKLGELQTLIAQLIRERDGYRNNAGTVLERRKLERGNKDKPEDDWPTTDTDSSDESAVEALEISSSGTALPRVRAEEQSREPDQVTRRILNLIEEMGSRPSNMDALIDTKFSPVKCCTGELMVV